MKKRKMADFDVIVVGGGHNGLVCAGYLAKSGLNTLVIERRQVVGGCCTTEELIPGYRFDVGAASHIWIRTTPIIQDLELERFGLRYLELEPMIFAPFKDRKHLSFYKDVGKTVKSIERLSKRDARAYERLCTFWRSTAKLLDALQLTTPVPLNEILVTINEHEGNEITRLLLTSAKRILEEEFETDYAKSQIAWIGATAGLNPAEPGTGGLIGHHFMLHDLGIARPVGGSGALTGAMRLALERFGGRLLLGAEVTRLLVENGSTTGVELSSGKRISSRIVVSAVDPKQSLLRFLGPDRLPEDKIRKVRGIRVINGMGVGTYLATTELPRYYLDGAIDDDSSYSRSLQSFCPSIEYIEESFSESSMGRVSRNYSMHVSTPTALDATLAPPGKHTVWVWSMFAPFDLKNGEDWADIGERESEKIVDILSEYSPNIRKSIIQKSFYTPVEYQKILSIPRGQYGHIDMSLDQMFALRPISDFSDYHTNVEGYYLTGAGTHPGGGVYGAPGHNTAIEILKDLGIIHGRTPGKLRRMGSLYKSYRQIKRTMNVARKAS